MTHTDMINGFPRFDGVPHDWGWIVESFRDTADADERLRPAADLCAWLAASPFAAAGLSGVKSMHDLIVGPDRDVLSNPHLVISFAHDEQIFHLRYEDGSPAPWSRTARPSEIRDVLERFFVKRSRWYRASEGAAAPGGTQLFEASPKQ
jgi:hypothetical protein